jgi:hypothetical protein
MTNLVEYILSLKNSQFNKGLGDSEGHINKLETSLASVRNAALGFIGAFASVEFLKGSIEMYNESAQASAQLDATLRSTANAANLNREALDAQADALMKTSLYDDDAITASQSLLATFTKVKDTIYMDAIPAIVDMSTKMGGDLQGTTLQVGKALNDPIKGIAALSRAGVSFTEEQKKTIKSMVEMNDVAGAQKLILQELQTEFGGSALAASQVGTGPMTVLKNEFNNVREEIGGMVMALIIDLKPALQDLVKGISSAVAWVKEHKDGLKALGFGIATAVVAFGTIIPLIEGFSAAVVVAGTETAVAATSMTAALGPIGLLAIAVTALAATYYDLAQAEERAEEMRNKSAKTHGNSVKEALEEDLALKVKAGGNELKLRKSLSDSFLKLEQEDLNATEDNLEKALFRQKLLKEQGYSSAAKDMQEGIDKLKGKVMEYQEGVQAAKSFGSGASKSPSSAIKAGGGAKPPATDKLEKATGQKAVTINVSINDLIHDFTIQTTNITESAQKVKEMVTNALLDAINNSQMIPIR